MPTTELSEFPFSLLIAAYLAVGFLAIITVVLLRISGQLTRIRIGLEKKAPATPRKEKSEEPGISTADPGSPFDEFLAEDPARRNLPKKEQFATYRQWRSEKGLNWSQANPD